MARFMRERGFDDVRRAVALVGRRPRGLLGRDLGPLRACGERGDAGARRRARCRARSGSPARRVNYAEHVFRGRADDALAIVAGGEPRELTPSGRWGELRDATRADRRRPARARRRARRPRGRLPAEHPRDRRPRSWRRASLGAVWSSCSPDFGARSVIDRFAQIEPKVLLAVDGYRYNGRDFDRTRRSSTAIARRRSAPRVVRLRLPRRRRAGRTASSARRATRELSFERVPFDHPLWVLYSSRHDRAAEGDRPGPGRDPARAPQDAAPAPRRAGRRPRSSGSRRPAG